MTLIPANYRGAPRGMWLRGGPDAPLPEGYARMLVDVLVDRDGEIRARGPLVPIQDNASAADAMGVVRNPAGEYRLIFLNSSDGTIKITDTDLVDKNVGVSLGWADPGYVDIKPSLNGTVWITVYAPDLSHTIFEWAGGSKHTTGTGLTWVAGNTAFAVSGGLTQDHVGGWLYLDGVADTAVGQIASVTSGTVGSLVPGSIRHGANITAQPWIISPFKSFMPLAGAGTISAETNSTQIFGSNTKFNEQAVPGSAFVFVEKSDAPVGAVSAVPGNTVITLGGNALIKAESERYLIPLYNQNLWFIAPQAEITGVYRYGAIPYTPAAYTAVYGGRQWYANRLPHAKEQSTIWYSELGRMEAVDFSRGSGIPIGGTKTYNDPIRNIIGTPRALLILKRDSAYMLTGNSPSNFRVDPLYNDGIVNPVAYGYWRDGVVWVGYKGIYYFDGASVTSLTDPAFGAEYSRMFDNMNIADGSAIRLHVHDDYVWISFRNVSSPFVVRRP